MVDFGSLVVIGIYKTNTAVAAAAVAAVSFFLRFGWMW
jgi:hypothetical protein